MHDAERTYTYEELCAAVSALDKAQRDDPIVSAYALHSFLEGRAAIDPRHLTDASRIVEWLREAADEIENAHRVLDGQEVPRVNPGRLLDVRLRLLTDPPVAFGELRDDLLGPLPLWAVAGADVGDVEVPDVYGASLTPSIKACL